MTELLHQLLDWIALHPFWAAAIVFLVAMAESLAVIGMVVPGVVLMFGFGALISTGVLSFWPTFGLAVAGAVTGDGLSFYIGRRFKQRLTTLWPFSKHPRSLEQGVAFFQRYGGKSVAFGRFFGPVRAVIPLVAGMLGMPPGRFLMANVASALVWAPAYLLPGIVLGASMELASEVAFGLVMLLLLLVASLWLVARLIRLCFRLLQPHAAGWVQRMLNWGELHPQMGRLSAALADPEHPEARGLAVLATLLILTTALTAFIFGAVLEKTALAAVDQTVLQTLQSLRTPWADHLMVHLSRLADWPVVLAPALGILLFLGWQRHWRTANYWLAAVGFGFLSPLLLQYGLRIPGPDIGIGHLGPYSFPSDHVMRATALFGFIAVMIARPLPPPRRWLPYSAAGLLICVVALSRLYLGIHWLSDVLAGLSLGIAWVALLGLAYHRHTVVEAHWRGLTAGSLVLLMTAAITLGISRHDADMTHYTAVRPERFMAADEWRASGWKTLPSSRQDLRGRRLHPLQLQYGGTLEPLLTTLQNRGWKPATKLEWGNALKLLSPSLPLADLPLLPQVHDGRHETVALTKTLPGGERLVMRLWPTETLLMPKADKLWIGNVSEQRKVTLLNLLTFPETLLEFHQPFAILLQDSEGLRRIRPDSERARVLMWNGTTPPG